MSRNRNRASQAKPDAERPKGDEARESALLDEGGEGEFARTARLPEADTPAVEGGDAPAPDPDTPAQEPAQEPPPATKPTAAPEDRLVADLEGSLALKRMDADAVGAKLLWLDGGLYYGSPTVNGAKIVDTDPVRKLFPVGATIRRTRVDEYVGFLPEGAARGVAPVTMKGRELVPMVAALSRAITG